jgi:hypothetical protein
VGEAGLALGLRRGLGRINRRAVSHRIGSKIAGRKKALFGCAPVIAAAHFARKLAPRRCDTAAQASRKIGNRPHAQAIRRDHAKSLPNAAIHRV